MVDRNFFYRSMHCPCMRSCNLSGRRRGGMLGTTRRDGLCAPSTHAGELTALCTVFVRKLGMIGRLTPAVSC